MLWLIFAAVLALVLGMLLYPLLRPQSAAPERIQYDIIVYRDQLAEVDRDVERGLLTPDQAEAARAEIYRRMLAAEEAESAAASPVGVEDSPRGRIALAATLAVGLPVGGLALYLTLGAPELPAQPYAGRKGDPQIELAEKTDRMAAMLAAKPDAAGYQILANAYFTMRRYEDAAEAYRQIIKLNGGTANTWSEYGEILSMIQDGRVVPEAQTAFAKALRLDPADARARFYLGLAQTQIGDLRRAVAIWRDLEKDSPADAPHMALLKERIAAIAKEGGFAPESIPPAPPSTSAQGEAMGVTGMTAPAGVDPAAADAVLNADPDDQQAMIRGMVDRLADKLKANPNDLKGWEMLATSYRVLGDEAKAKDAEAKAEALRAAAPAESSPAAAP